ncbi:MAG: hypothetical protein U1F43_01875 [Myxococcota bacterium]
MTGSRRSGSGRAPAPAQAQAAELHLVLEAHGHLLALSTAVIERMRLAEEVKPRAVIGGLVVESDGHAWPTWNLGTLLGLAPLSSAWILMHVPHATGSVRVALQTGPCLVVRPIARLGALPIGIFRERQGALAAVFDAAQVDQKRGAVAGLVIDAARLFTAAEVESSRGRILAHINAGGRVGR